MWFWTVMLDTTHNHWLLLIFLMNSESTKTGQTCSKVGHCGFPSVRLCVQGRGQGNEVGKHTGHLTLEGEDHVGDLHLEVGGEGRGDIAEEESEQGGELIREGFVQLQVIVEPCPRLFLFLNLWTLKENFWCDRLGLSEKTKVRKGKEKEWGCKERVRKRVDLTRICTAPGYRWTVSLSVLVLSVVMDRKP